MPVQARLHRLASAIRAEEGDDGIYDYFWKHTSFVTRATRLFLKWLLYVNHDGCKWTRHAVAKNFMADDDVSRLNPFVSVERPGVRLLVQMLKSFVRPVRSSETKTSDDPLQELLKLVDMKRLQRG